MLTFIVSNFDYIAPFYDRLVQLVFGEELLRIQKRFLSDIPKTSHILIVGGGTGQILIEVLKKVPNAKVCYLEASEKMINYSLERLKTERPSAMNQVLFRHSINLPMLPTASFDVIITPFVLDLFEKQTLEGVFKKLDQALSNKGIWIWTDFVIPQGKFKWPAWMLIQSMYLFFRIVAGISAKKLPDIHSLFRTHQYRLLHREIALKGIVESRVYRRNPAL